ncbi:hypothetical protein MAPG_03693 [Magnaporthiopsis poae ATCC 64411]|uniref:Solute carrier family 40 member n=1 Tax=Magnaporthiopsis poae (strain ATCC 64411 / 73-15) TaxID=644358 RepID=A0A0C4DUQ1_MAGP6|nr:hypothetical protein MAPG_03693 [Magnaporthiopsis poae ATCC 64411]
MGLAVYLPPVRTKLSLKPKDALLWLRSGLGVSRAGLVLFDLAVRDINQRLIKDKDYVLFTTAEIAIASLLEALGHFLAVLDSFLEQTLPPDLLMNATLAACICSFVVFSSYVVTQAAWVCIRRKKGKGKDASGLKGTT